MVRIALHWIAYILEDSDLENFWDFVEGWSSFAMKQGQRVLHNNKSATSHKKKKPRRRRHKEKQVDSSVL